MIISRNIFKYKRAFSLVELLVALSILAVIAAIIVPRYLAVQSAAESAVADQIAASLNTTYAAWRASGGLPSVVTANCGSLLLELFSGTANSVSGGGLTVADAGASGNFRCDVPPGAGLAAINAVAPTSTVTTDKYIITFDGERFSVALKSSASGQAIISLPGSLSFGTLGAGVLSGSRTITISNTGTAPLIVSGLSFPVSTYSWTPSVFSGSWSGSIPPGGSQSVTITFTPVWGLAYSGSMVVNSNAASGSGTVSCTGRTFAIMPWW